MPHRQELRRRARELLAKESRYTLPMHLRYLLLGVAAGLILGGTVFSVSQ